MEVATITSPSARVNIKPSSIKVAQEEMGRLDVLVCGQCHAVFHFIQEFQEHRSKEGACSNVSNFRGNNNIEPKAQVWAFLLWKDTQLGQILQDSPDKDNNSTWKLYQKWCKMDNHIRDGWILAGKTIQTFTKISNVKMQDVPQGGMAEGGKTVVLRKVIRNGQPDSPDKKDIKSDPTIKNEPIDHRDKFKLKSPTKSKGKSTEDENNDSDDDYYVEQIMAKRFNPKRKVNEYLLKWRKRNSLINKDNYSTWEDVSHVSMTYRNLMNDFETNLAKQKEIKAQQVAKSINKANQLGLGQKNVKIDDSKAGPSNASQAGRPMRLSKSKATDRVKQWCGSMRDDELLGKRKYASSDSDSDDIGIGSSKRMKADTSGGEDDWVADSDEDKTLIGRSDVIQRAFRGASIQSNGSNRDLLNVNKNVIKIEQKHSSPHPQSYLMHKKDGIIKLDSTPTNKISAKGPNQSGANIIMQQNRDSNVTRKQIVPGNTQGNSVTPAKVMIKADGTQVVTQMKVVQKSPKQPPTKNEPVKIQPKPDPNQQVQQIHLVAAIPSPIGIQAQRVVTGTTPTRPTVSNQRIDNTQRPLLPRLPSGGRTSTPTTNAGLVSITQTRAPARGQQIQQRQMGTVSTTMHQQQRPVVQKRVLPGSAPLSSIMQVSSTQSPSKPKVSIVSNQGKIGNKQIISPINNQQQQHQQQLKASPRTATVTKSQTAATPQQKMMLARKKLAAEAGIVPKPVGRTGKVGGGVRKVGAAGSAAQQGNKPKESKLAETDGLHMEFHEVDSESSSDGEPDFPPLPAESAQPCPEPESPRQMTLCPLTGRLIGPDGEPVEQPEPEPQPQAPTPMAIVSASTTMVPGTATISPDGIITTTASNETAELVLPNLDEIAESSGGIVRVEMSPGGTTGIVVQASEAPPVSVANVVMPGPDMPSLDDSSVEIQTTSSGEVVVNIPPIAVSETAQTIISTGDSIVTSAQSTTENVLPITTTSETQISTTNEAEALVAVTTKQEVTNTDTEIVVATDPTTGNVKLEENAGLVTITGEDGVVYQVAGQAEDGQTLLVTQGADGEQQCVYVTTEQTAGADGSVLTLDHAVAEAVAQFMPDQVNIGSQFYVKEGTAEETVESAEVANAENQQLVVYDTNTATIDESDNQVVAQVVSAEPPTEGGVRKVVLLLPDGNLMMTEVDEEQYAALELDK